MKQAQTTKTAKESGSDEMIVDCEIIHDSIGVTYFLPRKRCANCDD